MKRGLRRILSLTIIGASLVVSPIQINAGESNETKIREYHQYIRGLEQKGRKIYRGIIEYQHPQSNPEEDGRIAGEIIEWIYPLPGIGKRVERFHKHLEDSGYYEEMRRRARENQKRNSLRR